MPNHLYQIMTDAQIRKGLIEELAGAQEYIFNQFGPRMLGVCYRYVPLMDQAEALLQQGFVEAFSHPYTLMPNQDPEAWLRRYMIKICVNHLVTTHALQQQVEMLSFSLAPAEIQEPAVVLQAKDIVETVSALPVTFRMVINLYSIDGYRYEEIAKMLGMDESVCRSLYAHARMMLARILNAKGLIKAVASETVIIK